MRRKTRTVAVAVSTAIGLVCSSASSAEWIDPTAERALVLRLGAAAGLTQNSSNGNIGPNDPYNLCPTLSLSGDYRSSRHLSFGAITSGSVCISNQQFSRISAQVRYHFVRTRAFDGWGGGELGLAILHIEPGTLANEAPEAKQYAAIMGPMLGFDLMMGPYVSLGLEGRLLGGYFGPYRDRHALSGISHMFFLGLTLGIHVPL